MPVARQVFHGICLCARTFTKHVVAEAQPGGLSPGGPRLIHGPGNRLAQHELPPQQLDGAYRRCHNCACAQPAKKT